VVDPDGPENPPPEPISTAGAFRAAVVTLVVVAAIGLGVLIASSHHAAPPHRCTTTTMGLAAGGDVSSLTTLPPSHDNDAGRSRIPDNTPDADRDTSAMPPACQRANAP
jgi:hypothetical protein